MKTTALFFLLLMGLSPALSQDFYTVESRFFAKKVNLILPKIIPESVEPIVLNSSQMEMTNPNSTEQVLASPPLKVLTASSGFGFRKDPLLGSYRFHSGMDFQSKSSEVYAMLHGKVIQTGFDSGLGRFIKIRHGQYQAIYGHLHSIFVSPGDFVKPGMLIGITGISGRSTGDHLHLSIKKGDEPIPPLLFLKAIHMVRSKDELLYLLTP